MESGSTGVPNGAKAASSGPQSTSKKLNDLTKMELIALVQEYEAHSKLDAELIEALGKEQRRQTRMETFLLQDNDSFKMKLAESEKQAEAERKRAEEAYEKFEKLSLHKKVAEEEKTQKFFREKEYEKAIEKIQEECNNQVRELRNELRKREYEIEVLTRSMGQAKQ